VLVLDELAASASSSSPSFRGLALFAGRSGSSSTTLMPMSESIASTSSICSEETSSEGSTSFSSS
jgi:hypothetical protein